jgi:hypothetical protein
MMDAFDALVPNFARTTNRWPSAHSLSNHYKTVVASYDGGGHGLIATVKSFIECACVTILVESGKPMPSSEPSATELLVAALNVLGLQNSLGASKLGKLLSAHNKLADALSEVRNESCPVAHGKDGFLDALTINERRAFLLTADTILALLLCAHDGTEPDLQHTREPYDRFAHLHDRIDQTVAVESTVEDDEDRQVIVVTLRNGNLSEGVRLRVEPSRLLYAIDRTAYVEFLTSSAIEVSAGVAQELAREDGAIELRRAPEPKAPIAEVVTSYDGILAPFKKMLDKYLVSLGVTSTRSTSGKSLTDSLLAAAESHLGLDWAAREPLIAGMKVALRRTLLQFGMDREQAESIAEHLISWLKIQAAGLTTVESTQS